MVALEEVVDREPRDRSEEEVVDKGAIALRAVEERDASGQV